MEKEKKKKNEKSITIANIVSIIGIVVLLILSIVGYFLRSGGEAGWAILWPLLTTSAIALLLYLLIRAKGAENDLRKWRIAEIVFGIFYIGMAILSLIYGGVGQSITVFINKAEIQKYAENDINKIENLFTQYQNDENEALQNTYTELRNAINSRRNNNLIEFMKEKNISPTTLSVEAFIKRQRQIAFEEEIETYNFETLKKEFEDKKKDIDSDVKSWNILFIPFDVRTLCGYADDVPRILSELSSETTLPRIERQNGEYSLGELQKFEYPTIELQFPKALQKLDMSGRLVWVIIIGLIIHLLILFKYIVAARTHTIGLNRELEYDGGQTLSLNN